MRIVVADFVGGFSGGDAIFYEFQQLQAGGVFYAVWEAVEEVAAKVGFLFKSGF
ncbi:MAG: hypothetical protein WCD53_26990 [Microcoleus sp.]